MSNTQCAHCGATADVATRCRYCDEVHCRDHRLAQDHDCDAIVTGQSAAAAPAASPTGDTTNSGVSRRTLAGGVILVTAGAAGATVAAGRLPKTLLPSRDSNSPDPVTGADSPTQQQTETTVSNDNRYSETWDAAKTAKLVHKKVNQARVGESLQSLHWNTQLHNIAQKYAEKMATEDFYSHTAPDGGTFVDRYNDAGFNCRVDDPGSDKYYKGAENILMTYWKQRVETKGGVREYETPEQLATGMFDQWINSKPHRENIMFKHWDRQGIGVAQDDDSGRVYGVQNFC